MLTEPNDGIREGGTDPAWDGVLAEHGHSKLEIEDTHRQSQDEEKKDKIEKFWACSKKVVWCFCVSMFLIACLLALACLVLVVVYAGL